MKKLISGLPSSSFDLRRCPGKGRSIAAPEVVDDRLIILKIRDNHIGAGTDQAVSLPLVGLTASPRLVTGHGHGRAADALDVLDFDVSVPETEQLGPRDLVVVENSLDDMGLGEGLVLVDGSINVGFKKGGQS